MFLYIFPAIGIECIYVLIYAVIVRIMNDNLFFKQMTRYAYSDDTLNPGQICVGIEDN